MRDKTETDRIAEEAYVFLYPLVLMDVTRRLSTNAPAGVRPGLGPANAFSHMGAFPPGDFKEVIRPNFDTLYSIAWLDLADGPVIVSAPDTAGRYYMLPLLDMWTDVFAVIGSRTTGTGAGHYAIVPPDWVGELPGDVSRIDAPTSTAWIIGRTQTNGAADYESVHEIQRGFTVATVASWPDPFIPDALEPDPAVDMSPPMEQVAGMSGADFFAYGAELMASHRPHLVDQPILARMGRLGLAPGDTFDVAGADSEVQHSIERAPAAGLALLRDSLPRANPVVNGWSIARNNIGVYGTNYLFRATIAMIGLGANLAEDAVYPLLLTDESGSAPTGNGLSVLHFEADELPPADAFWSVTMYDGEGFPVPNALERYALGDRDPLAYNTDGSLDIYLGHEPPGPDRESNWLPAPEGPIGVTLRLYAPKPEVLDGRWSPPPLRVL